MSRQFCHLESDARTKWCPFARATMFVRGNVPGLTKPVDLVGHAANRLVTDDDAINKKIEAAIAITGATRCMGSKCMAWRFVETHIADENGDLTILSGDTHGYCGLAGKPE